MQPFVENLYFIVPITLIIFIAVMFLLSNFKKMSDRLKPNKWVGIGFDISVGLFVGFISAVYFMIGKELNPLFFFAVIWPCAIFFSKYTSVGSFIPFFAFSLWQTSDPYTSVFYVLVYLAFMVLMWLSLSTKIFNIKVRLIVSQILFSIITGLLVMMIISTPGSDKGIIAKTWWISMLLNFFLIIVFGIIANQFYRIYNKAEFLQGEVVYENEIFINSSYYHENIKKFILDNNTSTGFMMVFTVEGIGGAFTDKSAKTMKNDFKITIFRKIAEETKSEKIVFFKTKNNRFACFVDASTKKIELKKIYAENKFSHRDPKDPLHLYSTIGERISQTFVNKSNFNLQIKFGVSIYGVHSCDIEDLIKKSESINFDESEENVCVQVYNPNVSFESEYEMQEYLDVCKIINPKKIKIIFNQQTINDKKIFVPMFIYPEKIIFGKEKIMHLIPNSNQDFFERHMGAKTILEYSKKHRKEENGLVIVDYPISKLTTGMHLAKLNKTASYCGLQNEVIILSFDVSQITYVTKRMTDNLEKIINAGYKIAFKNISADNFEILSDIKPFVCSPGYIKTHDQKLKNEYESSIRELLEKTKVNIINSY